MSKTKLWFLLLVLVLTGTAIVGYRLRFQLTSRAPETIALADSHEEHKTDRKIAYWYVAGRTGSGGAAFAFADWPAPGIEKGCGGFLHFAKHVLQSGILPALHAAAAR